MSTHAHAGGTHPFQPLSRQTLAAQVADQVRAAVVSRELRPHAPIAEGRLAEQLGVSRAPVREALMQLEREGLIESSDTGRRRVRKLTPADFDELLDLRIALESRAFYRLATRMTDAIDARLEASIQEQVDCKVLLELSLLDIEFHTIVAECAGNGRLLDVWLRIRPQLQLWLAQMHEHHETATHATFTTTVDSHRALLNELRRGEPEAAERAIRAHIDGWRTMMRRPDGTA